MPAVRNISPPVFSHTSATKGRKIRSDTPAIAPATAILFSAEKARVISQPPSELTKHTPAAKPTAAFQLGRSLPIASDPTVATANTATSTVAPKSVVHKRVDVNGNLVIMTACEMP